MHETDTWCIGILALNKIPNVVPDFGQTYCIRQFRRQDRSLVYAQTERVYKLDGVTIAKNRKNVPNRKQILSMTGTTDRWLYTAKRKLISCAAD